MARAKAAAQAAAAVATIAMAKLFTPSNYRGLSLSFNINPVRSSYSYSLQQSTLKSVRDTHRTSNFGISASSMSIEASEMISGTSFLDRKESGFRHVAKYHGLGNDFIVGDNRDSMEPGVTLEHTVKLCDRSFVIGAGGIIFVMPGTNGTDYTQRIFNSDGSEPEMCGNGVRSFARFIDKPGNNLRGKKSFAFHTGAGLIVPEIQDDGKVRVDMDEPILKAADIPTKLPANKDRSVVKSKLDVDGVTWNVTSVSMGNPDRVTFSAEGSQNLQVNELNLADIGPKFGHHSMFPARTNTDLLMDDAKGFFLLVPPSSYVQEKPTEKLLWLFFLWLEKLEWLISFYFVLAAIFLYVFPHLTLDVVIYVISLLFG